MIPEEPTEPVLRDGDVELVPTTEAAPSFEVRHRGEVVGQVAVTSHEPAQGVGRLTWWVEPDRRGFGVGARAVRLLVGHAFDRLGLSRVEAYLDPDDVASRRTASRSGLRAEGTLRQRATTERGRRRDQVLVARVAGDPEPFSREGFLGVLNAGLPTKRVITQGLIRDRKGRLLMCELVYKKEWDLPGGVVDPFESPAFALVREVAEELRIDVVPERLVAVNWLPPYRGWDDAVLFVYDLGVHNDVVEQAVLQPREIRALHWCDPADVEAHAAPYVTRMLRRLARQQPASHRGEGTAYLEDGADPS